ncbi:MAG TPA: TIGR04282 family arsenosugar biosynthesis glycosyltransferase [Aggregatilineales bacterium]|jgi:rSAM/selenodomain-associated transferase 1|nr:TIGR04282 family arsenosugar biosynthesis glycosyltransferase [Aggregatilineales bacterium]
MTVKKAVVLMAKAPLPGEVKTRLTPRLTAFQAAELYRCFLLDAVEQAQEVCGADVVLAYAPANGLHLLPAEVRSAVPCIPQPGGHLGERMRGVFEALFALGYESVVMTGTDLPTLPPRYTGAAFDLLEDAPVVLGPGLDGGYYLLGLRGVLPDVFEGIEWSTSRVFQQTYERLHRLGHAVRCTPPWYDVDNADDLDRLITHLTLLQGCRAAQLPRHTTAWLQRVGLLPELEKGAYRATAS